LGSDLTLEDIPPIEPRLYARFSRRLQALILDSAVYAAGFVVVLLLIEVGGGGPAGDRVLMVLLLGFLFLYEPVMVWRRGATLGHAWKNIRVVDTRTGGNPGFMQALGRFWLKGIFGLLAFAFMATTRRHQALHDLPFGTTVEIRNPAGATLQDHAVERLPDPTRVPPPGWRRVAVILVYTVLAFILLMTALVTTASAECFYVNRCSVAEQLWQTVVELAWIALQAAIIIFGWQGRLTGARSRQIAEPFDSSTHTA
jgi:uncharacterized RDD family membrane protein YckC